MTLRCQRSEPLKAVVEGFQRSMLPSFVQSGLSSGGRAALLNRRMER